MNFVEILPRQPLPTILEISSSQHKHLCPRQVLVARYDCRSCHRIAGQGALKGPALDDAAARLDHVSLRLWLRNPRAIKGNTAMPNFHLSDSEVEAVVAYLESLADK